MQKSSGRALLMRHGLDPDDPVSFLLVDDGRAWRDTSAIVRVLAGLGGLWRAAILLRAVPQPLRDRAYRWLARNRYRWFGRNEACLLPPADFADRFLD
jgi:predicted DCC family thiol-disulfide oxidoreductase YuxK